MSSILKAVKELAQSWYAVDRIRVAPNVGRLLQLSVGDSIMLRNEIYTIQKRKLIHNDRCGRVVFRLVDSESEAELTVPFDEGKGGEGTLTVNGESSIVFDTDVTIRQSSVPV